MNFAKLLMLLSVMPLAVVAAEVPSGPTLAERALEALVPTNMVNEAAGFFGPVAKKHMPQFEAFEREYMASSDKFAVVEKYLPVAADALADARKMRVPPRYEKKKAEYIKFFESAYAAANLTVRLRAKMSRAKQKLASPNRQKPEPKEKEM